MVARRQRRPGACGWTRGRLRTPVDDPFVIRRGCAADRGRRCADPTGNIEGGPGAVIVLASFSVGGVGARTRVGSVRALARSLPETGRFARHEPFEDAAGSRVEKDGPVRTGRRGGGGPASP